MLIRRETVADIEAIQMVIAAAFASREGSEETPPEVALVGELRASDAWLAALSLVALDVGGDVVGHVVCTRGQVDAVPALALGPLGVRPDRQRRGVGMALVHAVLGAADALGEPLVAVLGDPRYYSRFGFCLGEECGIIAPVPEWGPHFQVRALAAYSPSLRGTFVYAEPFGRV